MKSTQILSASAFVALAFGASLDALQVEFVTALVNDLRSNRGQYLGYVATASNVPSGVTQLALAVATYTDDSYTTLIAEQSLDVGQFQSFATQLPWYSRIEDSLTPLSGGSGSASATATSGSSEASSAASSRASGSSSGSGSSITSAPASSGASHSGSASSHASSHASSGASHASSDASSHASDASSHASSHASSASSSTKASSSKAAGAANFIDSRLISLGSLIACLL
jgi:hypothetical protein